MHFVDEYQKFGFRPSEIVGLLAAHEIPIDLGDKAADPVIGSKPMPEWKRIMALEPCLPVSDWVHALIGADPYETCYLHDDLRADFQRYEDMLHRAISRKEVQATESTTARNEKTWTITAESLVAWCQAKGISYPLPLHVSAKPYATTPLPSIAGRWPWGDHSTKALELLADAAKQWWSSYDSDEPSTAPTNNEVIEYLTSKSASTKLADSIASILRADDLRTGRRKGSAD